MHLKENTLSELVDILPTAVYVCNAEGAIEIYNPSAAELWGRSPVIDSSDERYCGSLRIFTLDGSEMPHSECPMARVLHSGQPELNQEIVFERPDGSRRVAMVNIVPRRNAVGVMTGAINCMTDITERKQAEQRIHYMAHYDALTGLPNRILLQDRMQQAVAHARRDASQVVVLFVDLDNFKNINDSLGHQTGDLLLKKVAARLHDCLREGDSVARIGGDEFVLMLSTSRGRNDAALIARKVLRALEQSFCFDDLELHVSCSIGISLFPDDGGDVETLMRTADTAMYHAKAKGRSNYQFFTEALNQAAHRRFGVEKSLREALARNEFELHYQPQVDIASGAIISAEGLLRWHPPGKPTISCGAFISVAEESGLIMPIGDWVLHQACQQLQYWRTHGHPELKIAVNLSPRQFYHPDLLHSIERLLEVTGLPATALNLEITESILMQPNKDNISKLKQLHNMGILLSVDDFGTGYSSLAYLQRFPIDALKIDQSFIRGIGINRDNTALVKAIIAMGQSLRMKILAEGVETEQQAEFLLAHNCPAAQGHFYSKAVPAHTLSTMLPMSFAAL